ncbi:MAG: CocE/NonD family hydrolase, partial [bacterium]|nr:CocE/NonD family hydrolase [bacterium]
PQAAGGAIGKANDRCGYFGAFEGGAFALSAGFGWFRGSGSKVKDAPPPSEVDMAAALKTLSLVDMHARFGGPPSDWEGFVSHEPADPWWDRFGYISDRDRFNTPALHVNSWYDFGAAETLYFFNLMQRNAESETARDNQFVVISPMTHCLSEVATERTTVGALEVGDARFAYWDLYLRWFDYWLRGKDNGVTEMPKVLLFVTGKNQWRAADAWPLPQTRSTAYYLHSGGGANTRHGDGRLSAQEPTPTELPDRFTYDPADPVPSRGGSVCCTGNPEDQPGAFDQSDIEERPDVLVYTSDPLEGDLNVIGPLKVVLYVSSSAKDTDFTAKLLDVHPGGSAYNLQEGILRARYREGYDKSLRMEAGEVVRLEIDLHATAHTFAPGHRIRLEVASSNFPRFDRNLNTGGNNYDETEWVVANNTVHHSPEHPSHVVLAIVP